MRSVAMWWLAATFSFLLAAFVMQSDVGTATASLAAAATFALLGVVGSRWQLQGIAQTAVHVPAVRDRLHRTVFVPQFDPDAPGRPRPRAPGLR